MSEIYCIVQEVIILNSVEYIDPVKYIILKSPILLSRTIPRSRVIFFLKGKHHLESQEMFYIEV